MRVDRRLAMVGALLAFAPASANIYLTEGTNLSVDIGHDGRYVTDVLGTLWLIPATGGEAEAIDSGEHPARRPRWSPDGQRIVYESTPPGESRLRLYSFDDAASRTIGSGPYTDRHPAWHPDGERIVFASARDEAGFDIWEIDVPTGLVWRLSRRPGDESEPAWSPNGRDLLYVHEFDGQWQLVLRRRGAAEEVLLASDRRIAAPSWRPDGTLVTYLEQGDAGWSIGMTILSKPRLKRTLVEDEDFFLSPIVWADRQTLVYASNGKIRKRAFNSWASTDVPFRARVGALPVQTEVRPEQRSLPASDAPAGRTVIRASRLFDGVGSGYRRNQDIVIDGARIDSVRPRSEHADAIVIDLGNATVIPGFVDAYARLSEGDTADLGPLLLGLGVTTLVAETGSSQSLTRAWSGKDLPGPRVLAAADIEAAEDNDDLWLVTIGGDRQSGVRHRARVRQWQSKGVPVLAKNWQVALGSGASLLLGTGKRPVSPGGRSYQDVQLASGDNTVTLLSGLADAATPGIDNLRSARVAAHVDATWTPAHRFDETPKLSAAASTIVLGSLPNGLPAGLALHAELRALVAAGLSETQALKAAGVNAAAALGLGLDVGRIATGAAADLVIVAGDPLSDINDAVKIIAVVRNGRFFSLSGLLDRSKVAKNVD